MRACIARRTYDFKKVDAIFEKDIEELRAAGAVVIDPIVIPDLKKLLATRASAPGDADESIRRWMARNPNSPYKTREDVRNSPDIGKLIPAPKAAQWGGGPEARSCQVLPVPPGTATTEDPCDEGDGG